MAANTSPIFVKAAHNEGTAFLPADSTNLKTIYTAGAEGSLITAICGSSDDTAAHDVELFMTIGGTDYPVGVASVPITAGTLLATAAVNLLTLAKMPWLLADGTLFLPASAVLKAKMLVAVTAAKTVNVVALGGDY